MTSSDETAREPRSISKVAFESLVFVAIIVLVVIETVAALMVGRALGHRIEGGWIGGLTVLNIILARVGVDGILKWFGLSRSGKTIEARGRTLAFPEDEIDDDEVVEVRCPSSLITGLGVAFVICCLLIILLLAAIPHRLMEGIGWAYALLGFCGLGAVYFLYEGRWGKPQAWADASGITGYPVGPYLRRRFVPWSDVATCEIETYYDTFGKPVIIRPILKGWHGEPLIVLNLLYTKMEDQERLVKYIKAKLPKPKVDLWD